MKSEWKKREGERLYQWIDRLAMNVAQQKLTTAEFHDLMSEISKTSYIEGVHAARAIYGK